MTVEGKDGLSSLDELPQGFTANVASRGRKVEVGVLGRAVREEYEAAVVEGDLTHVEVATDRVFGVIR